MRKNQPAGQLEKYAKDTRDIDAIHFDGHAAPIPVLLQFANYEQYFDKTSMQHYVEAASDPKKVLYYDTGHDLNDPEALQNRYAWLMNHIGLRRDQSFLTRVHRSPTSDQWAARSFRAAHFGVRTG